MNTWRGWPGTRYELEFEAEPFQGYTEFDELEWADEGAEGEWDGEVNLKDRAYVRRVQSALNRLLNLRLTADGLWGTQTSKAVRAFQQRRGLQASGVLDSQTERALFAADDVPRPGGGGKVSAPACAAAASDLERLANSLTFLGNELRKTPPSQTRLKLLKELVRLDVEVIVSSLSGYIAAGCCEPSLKMLEAAVAALPWPADPDAQARRDRLLDAIRKAQAAAKKDTEHC